MNIKEIALKVAGEIYDVNFDEHKPCGKRLISLAEALISAYKAELLNEVGEPVACVVKDDEDEGEQLMYPAAIFKYKMASEDDIISYLYTSDQVAAAILKATKPLEEVKEALGEYLCSADDSPSAVRRLVSAYQERNNSAAKYCSQLNEQDAELEQLRSQLAAASNTQATWQTNPAKAQSWNNIKNGRLLQRI